MKIFSLFDPFLKSVSFCFNSRIFVKNVLINGDLTKTSRSNWISENVLCLLFYLFYLNIQTKFIVLDCFVTSLNKPLSLV